MSTPTSEYLREPTRGIQVEQAKKRLRKLIEAGLSSGPGPALTHERAAQLKQQALGLARPDSSQPSARLTS